MKYLQNVAMTIFPLYFYFFRTASDEDELPSIPKSPEVINLFRAQLS